MAENDADQILRTRLEIDNQQYNADLDEWVSKSKDATKQVASDIKVLADETILQSSKIRTQLNVNANLTNYEIKKINEEIVKPLTKEPAFATTYKRAFDDIEQRANKTKKTLQQITESKLKAGDTGLDFQSAEVGQIRLQRILNELRLVKAEAAKPENANFANKFRDDIKGLEVELDKLESKANRSKRNLSNTTQSSGSLIDDVENGTTGFGKIPRIRGFGAIIRGSGLGINELELNAGISLLNLYRERLEKAAAATKVTGAVTEGLTAAEQANNVVTAESTALKSAETLAAEEETAALAAQSAAIASTVALTVVAVAAAAAAIYAAYHITSDIRIEAERRLKVEELLTIEYGKQQKALYDAGIELQKNLTYDKADYDFKKNLNSSNEDSLKDQLKRLQDIQKISNAVDVTFEFQGEGKDRKQIQKITKNEDYERRSQQIRDLASKIRELDDKQLNDPSFSNINEAETKAKADKAVFDEKEAAKADKRAEKLKKQFEELQAVNAEVRSFLTTNAFAGEKNPFAKLMTEFETATDRAEKKFSKFGKTFVEQMAEIDKARINAELNTIRFENNLSALKDNQEARRLDQTPNTQIDSFQRRLGVVSTTADYVAEKSKTDLQIYEANFNAYKFNPNNPIDFLQNKFGKNLTNDNIDFKLALEKIDKLNTISTQNTGVYGQGLIAQKILEAIPDSLIPKLLIDSDTGNAQEKFDASRLLKIRAGAYQQKGDLEDQKFKDFIENQKFLDLTKQDAAERLKLLQNSGLSERDKNQQFLNITGELGTANLTPALKQARIDALNKSSDFKLKDEETAKAQNKKVNDVMLLLEKVLSDRGIKFDLGDKALFDLNINSKDISVDINQNSPGKATTTDTAKQMGLDTSTGTFYNQYQNQ